MTAAETRPTAALPLILLGEDEADDAFLIRRALDRAGVRNPIKHLHDGEETIAYLQGLLDDPSVLRPSLLLLDLKMPRKGGFEVLQWIREQPAFKTLPVAILTSSQELQDIGRAAALGATSFLTKSSSFVGVAELIRAVSLG